MNDRTRDYYKQKFNTETIQFKHSKLRNAEMDIKDYTDRRRSYLFQRLENWAFFKNARHNLEVTDIISVENLELAKRMKKNEKLKKSFTEAEQKLLRGF